MATAPTPTSSTSPWILSPPTLPPQSLDHILVPNHDRQPQAQVLTDATRTSGSSNSSLGVQDANPFLCNVCKQSYSRLDHLSRHYRSHTRERPFGCMTCNKSFGRADLLKRHVRAHSSGKGQRGEKGSQRNPLSDHPARAAKACTACASAKLKCDDEKPCRRCRQSNVACKLPTAENDGVASTRVSADTILKLVSPISIEIDRPSNRSQTSIAGTEELENSQDVMDQGGMPDISRFEQSHNPPPVMFSASNFPPPNAFQESSILPSISAHTGRSIAPSQESDDLMELDDSSLAKFLRGIITPPAPNTLSDQPMAAVQQLQSSRDVFDFGIDTSLDFNDVDLDWILNFNSQEPVSNFRNGNDLGDGPLSRGQQTPDISNGLNLGAEAFRKSLWQWAPQRHDNGYEEQENLLLSYKELSQLDTYTQTEPTEQSLYHTSRDHILAMLVSTCSPGTFSRVVSSFPSTRVLNSLMQLHIKTQATSSDSWIHFPSFRPNDQRPQLNAIIIAAGAVASSIPALKKLGFAIQEAVRLAIPQAWENDNRLTRDLHLLQAYALQLSIMVWSGNKRKMEIGESHAQPLITMLRRACRYRQMRKLPDPPHPEDSNAVLETKWLQWVECESFKRLAFHTLIHDSQISVAFLVRPLLSHAEVSLELPCSQALWLAPDNKTWRDIYLSSNFQSAGPLPSLPQCLHDTRPLLRMQHSVDFQMSASIILHAIWSLIAEYRQLEHASKVQAEQRHWNGVLTSWHQELCQLLDNFCISVSESKVGIPSDMVMFQHLCMMNLHVSFEELQLFAGKEGSEEAHRVYPSLKAWKESRKARQAIWHAGQVVRAARTCHPTHLKGFSAIALYHASLAFWVYGMISMSTSRSEKVSEYTHETSSSDERVWLDELETAAMRRFIAVGRGCPVISDDSDGVERGSISTALENPKAVMDATIKILSNRTNRDRPLVSPLAENLVRLMQDLGNAALVIGNS